jgi:hypothetical protein
MPGTEPQIVSYAVTLEVFVPVGKADTWVDRLDAAWHSESWTPQAAAFMAAHEALKAAGLDDVVHVSTREVAR